MRYRPSLRSSFIALSLCCLLAAWIAARREKAIIEIAGPENSDCFIYFDERLIGKNRGAVRVRDQKHAIYSAAYTFFSVPYGVYARREETGGQSSPSLIYFRSTRAAPGESVLDAIRANDVCRNFGLHAGRRVKPQFVEAGAPYRGPDLGSVRSLEGANLTLVLTPLENVIPLATPSHIVSVVNIYSIADGNWEETRFDWTDVSASPVISVDVARLDRSKGLVLCIRIVGCNGLSLEGYKDLGGGQLKVVSR